MSRYYHNILLSLSRLFAFTSSSCKGEGGIEPEPSTAVELAYVACDDVAQDDDMSQPRDDSLSHQVGEHFCTVSKLILNKITQAVSNS